MRKLRSVLVVAALSLVLLPGCKGKGDEEKKGEEKKAGVVEVPKAPETADGVVKEFVKAFGDKEPGRVYHLLPESYQKDIQGLKDLAIEKLDKEIVDNGLKAFDKIMSGVAKHKEKLLANDLPIPGISKEAMGGAVDLIVKLWGVLKDAGLGTYDGWKALDVGQFLLQNGKAIMEAVMEIAGKTEQGAMVGMMAGMVSALAVEVKETGADFAVLSIGMGEDKKDERFVKVEGKWIPEEMSKEWAEGMKEAREELQEALEGFEKDKEQIKAMSAALLAAATTFEETGDVNQLLSAFEGPAPAAE
ncbi:MAG: hypothetical protein FJ098_13220 [Deltaproteobacteria bacterium]|nr:hypothetical protein [Deltaproteobacteria bacterium]